MENLSKLELLKGVNLTEIEKKYGSVNTFRLGKKSIASIAISQTEDKDFEFIELYSTPKYTCYRVV